MKPYKRILLLSGFDSYITWHYVDKPRTIYFSLGHKYERQEEEWISQLVPGTIFSDALDLRAFEEPSAFIPLRNHLLVSMASIYAEEVILTVQKGELDLTDRNPIFMYTASGLLSYLHERPTKVWSPFVNYTKTDMVRWYVKSGYSVENLKKTRSCYSTGDKPCGRCSACFRRWVAMINNGIEEEYANDILEYKEIPVYINKMQNDEYDEQRVRETFDALKRGGYEF